MNWSFHRWQNIFRNSMDKIECKMEAYPELKFVWIEKCFGITVALNTAHIVDRVGLLYELSLLYSGPNRSENVERKNQRFFGFKTVDHVFLLIEPLCIAMTVFNLTCKFERRHYCRSMSRFAFLTNMYLRNDTLTGWNEHWINKQVVTSKLLCTELLELLK